MLFIKGMILGFSIAAPVGPMGVLCIRRTLARGMMSGFFSGLGNASADAVYGVIAAGGVSALAVYLLDSRLYLNGIGGMFLLYLGWKIFWAQPAVVQETTDNKGLLEDYLSSFVLTLTNPATILAFAAVFASMGAGLLAEDTWQAVYLVAGVFCGSLLWWLILSSGVSRVRHGFTPARMKQVNQISGMIIAGFGVASLWSLALLTGWLL